MTAQGKRWLARLPVLETTVVQVVFIKSPVGPTDRQPLAPKSH
jgi:hypothetical protein